MEHLKKSISDITNSPSLHGNLSTFIHNKGNAKLGDSLVNFIYSIAKSIASEKPTGIKVSDSILTESYKRSLWHKTQTLKLTGEKGRIADAIEALILYFWINQSVPLEKLITPLIAELEPSRLHHPREEKKTAVLSFQKLLDELFQSYLK